MHYCETVPGALVDADLVKAKSTTTSWIEAQPFREP
jgi:hypothetical protein